MTIVRGAGPAVLVVLALGVAGCAERGTGSPPPDAASPSSAQVPADPAALVFRVEYTGGFVTPETTVGRLPVASVYGDGRVFVEGPVALIYPGFAWPNVQVLDIGADGVQELADRALAAGVAETGDLGTPPIADAPSTRFTLVTEEGTHVREVYALSETAGMPGSGLTDEQEAARAELLDLFTAVGDLAAGPPAPEPWTPDAVAAITRPWTASDEDVAQGLTPEAVAWPGPPLPGEPVGPLPDLGCVTATGEQAAAVVAAAQDANVLTPWLSPDGSRWSVTFRPLLPDETGCADLTG
ncbi:hypothetical protein [Blastococcus litoris]|uniref:hypothetical protein n=1 Tax=Blastococcus litoris TaxID=2171622 RepID=UPI000E309435|nr:hypothetical protein [Blastococcus litoris]